MRYVVAAALAAVLVGTVFWLGARLANTLGQGSDVDEPYLRGETENLCGYEVDTRYSLAGYELERWRGERCRDLSSLDHCLLACLSEAGTIEAARDCYPSCIDEADRRTRQREERLW